MKIVKPEFDFKNVALYHIAKTRYEIYNDWSMFKNSNYFGKELVCMELENLFTKLTYLENELKYLKEKHG